MQKKELLTKIYLYDLSLEPFVIQNFQTVSGMINTFPE